MKEIVIAGNWKMNHGIQESLDFIRKFKSFKLDSNVKKVIAAPYTNLYALSKEIEGTDISLAAQNMFYKESGAYTGEISPVMLSELGVEYVILGHSERRELFLENDELIRNKLDSALNHGLKVILCCGETLEEREKNEAYSKIEKQVKAALEGLTNENMKNVIIAYEPIWAIGTGKTASSDDAQDMCSYIRGLIKDMHGDEIASQQIIQYGGSVKVDNIKDLLSKDDINGALVGGASLKAEDFKGLVNYNYEK